MVQIIKVPNFEYYNPDPIHKNTGVDHPWDYFRQVEVIAANTLPNDASLLALPDEYICYGNNVGKIGMLKLHSFRTEILECLPKALNLSNVYVLCDNAYYDKNSKYILNHEFVLVTEVNIEKSAFFYTYAISQVQND